MVAGSMPSTPATVRDGEPPAVVTFSTTPVWERSFSSVYVTVRPMRLIALVDERLEATVWFAAAMFVICSSVENDAIWPIMSLSCIGFIGS